MLKNQILIKDIGKFKNQQALSFIQNTTFAKLADNWCGHLDIRMKYNTRYNWRRANWDGIIRFIYAHYTPSQIY